MRLLISKCYVVLLIREGVNGGGGFGWGIEQIRHFFLAGGGPPLIFI